MQMPLFEGDLVIHFLGSMFESENGGIGDFWVMKGGENFTITSNESDFPPGFELHPTEVSDGMTYRLMERLRSGWRPGEIVTAPNIWRVKEGDRVLLLGERSWLPGGEFCSVFEFSECALVFWLTASMQMPLPLEGMGAEPSMHDEKRMIWMKTAVDYVKRLGLPRSMAFEWRISR